MHTRTIGPLTVSAIGLGCMNMSMGYGVADDAESAKLLNAALDDGYTFLDTAALYGGGHNERLIGSALASRRREYVLATKGGYTRTADGNATIDGRPESVRRDCEASLTRLGTDVIDLYYIHRPDTSLPIEETTGALADLKAAGKVRAIGFSEVCTENLRRAHAEHPVDALQSEYSLWSRTPESGVLDACAELGITFVPFSPLARGFLAGSSSDVNTLSESDLRATIARPRFEPDNFAHNQSLLTPFNAIATREGCSPAQLALAWLLAQRDSAGQRTQVPIPGTKHIDWMHENAGAGDIALDADTVAELDELINESTVRGNRYTDALMASADSERDRV